jgi:hypothetical protein
MSQQRGNPWAGERPHDHEHALYVPREQLDTIEVLALQLGAVLDNAHAHDGTAVHVRYRLAVVTELLRNLDEARRRGPGVP